jgi:hypothetical protein
VAVLPGGQVGPPVFGHLGLAELAHDAAGQDLLDEQIVLQHHLLARGRAQRAEQLLQLAGQTGPGQRFAIGSR